MLKIDLTLLKESGGVLLLKVIAVGAAYIFTILSARTLGAESWGVFSICFVILQISSLVARFGLDSYFLRFVAKYRSKRREDLIVCTYKKILFFLLSSSLLMTLILIILSPYLANVFFKEKSSSIYLVEVSLGILPFSLILFYSEAFKGYGLPVLSAFLTEVLFYVSVLLIFILFITLDYKSDSVPILSFVIASYLVSFLLIVIWHKKSRLDRRCSKGFPLKALLKGSSFMLISNSLAMVMGWTDIIMLGIFTNEKLVGVYNIVLRLVGIFNMIFMAVNSTFSPKLVIYFNSHLTCKVQELVRKSSFVLVILSLPIFLVYVLMPEFILDLFGSEFVIGSLALMVLSIARFLRLNFGFASSILLLTGNQHIYMYILAFSLPMNVFLNLLLIPYFGLLGASLATFISIIFLTFVSVAIVYKKLKIKPTWFF